MCSILAKNKQILNDLTEGPVLRQLLLFSLPLMAAYALQGVYNIVDMIVVGRFVGAAGLSAVGIGGQIQNFIMFIGMGFASASQIMISQQVGSGDYDGIKRTIGTALTLLTILAILCGGACMLLMTPILHLVNTPAESFSEAFAYCFICSAGTFFVYGYNGVCAILRGMGESKLPMYFVSIAAVINIVLDLLFVAVFDMGAGGAALATIIAQGISFILSLITLYRRREAFHFDFKPASFRPDAICCKGIFKMGFPLILQSVMISVSMIFVNANVNAAGVVASAVDGIGNKLNTVTFSLINGLSIASASMLGQCFGARKHSRLKKVYWYATAIAMGIFVFLAAVCIFFPEPVFRLFTSEAEVIAYAPTYMKIAIVFYLSNCTMLAPYALMEGTGAAGLNLFIGILDGVAARLGLGILLGGFIGVQGYWLGSALAGFVTTIGGSIYYFSGKWKTKKLLIESVCE